MKINNTCTDNALKQSIEKYNFAYLQSLEN